MKTNSFLRNFLASFLIIALFIPSFCIIAYAGNSGIEYEILEDSTVKITKVVPEGNSVVIPEQIDSYTVSALAKDAFAGCSGVTKLVLPSSLNRIEEGTFFGCLILSDISFSADNDCFAVSDGMLLNKDRTRLYFFFNRNSVEEVSVPQSVTRIDSFSFYGSPVKSVMLGDATNYIGVNSFYNSSVTTLKSKNNTLIETFCATHGFIFVNLTPNGWVKENGRYRFYIDHVAQTGFLKVNGKTYYFDDEGYMLTDWQKINGKWYYFNPSGSMKTGWLKQGEKWYYLNSINVNHTKKGIDVSTFQGNIDWAKVRKDGYEFAMIRGGYGKNKDQKDAQFENNYKNAKAVGMPIGVYHYSYATTVEDAKKEAEFCLSYLKGKKFEYPIAYDIEESSQSALPKQTLTNIIKTFCERLKEEGYYVIIYSSKSWLTNVLDMSQLSDYDVWVAQYYNEVTYEGDYTMWQYTSKGSVDGIDGNVDLDYSYKSYEVIIPASCLNGFTENDAAFIIAKADNGEMLRGWQNISCDWYYFDSSGVALKGLRTIKNKLYYFDENRIMQTGWKKVGGKWYYFSSNGNAKTGLQQIGNKLYYFDENCVMKTGWKKLDGKWYYFSTGGSAKTGFAKIDGVYYYFNDSCIMQKGWKKIGGSWYYFNSNGAMKTGWLKLNGKWYYLNSNGKMAVKDTKIGRKTYRFDSSGVCLNP